MSVNIMVFQHSPNLPLDIEVSMYASVVDVLSLNKRSDFNNLQTLLTKLNVSHAGLIRHWPPHSTFVLQVRERKLTMLEIDHIFIL